jgi:Aminoarabinose transferase C-terminal domain
MLVGAMLLPNLLQGVRRGVYFQAMREPLAVMGLLLLGGASWALATLRRSSAPAGTTAAYLRLGSGAYAALCVLLLSAGMVGRIYSGRSLAEFVPASLAVSVPVYSVRTYEQTLPFYWRRTVTLVDYRGELDHGLRHDSSHYVPTVEQFARRWIDEPQAFAIMEPAQFAEFRLQGLPMHKLGEDARRILVSRR